MNPFDPRCHDFSIFLKLTYWNICQSSPAQTFLKYVPWKLTPVLSACNIFTDVCLGALPVPIIWTLKMRLRVRIYVIVILNLGYL